VPNLPISFKDFDGVEDFRTYSDQWGFFSGLNYSTWEVNPPNPTGYAPAMMVPCMNDPGNGPTPDPLYNPSYSQFCYETPFMPDRRSTWTLRLFRPRLSRRATTRRIAPTRMLLGHPQHPR